MIRKSVQLFSDKIMLNQFKRADRAAALSVSGHGSHFTIAP